MGLAFKLKHYFFNAFRELFVHHHGSLEFRARVFALVLMSYEHIYDDYFDKLKELATKIYKDDEDRANLLVLLTKEFTEKTNERHIGIDETIAIILKELKIAPRFAKKIDIKLLKELSFLSHDKDINDFQTRILEFLSTTKDETLHTNKEKIEKDEQLAKGS